MPSYYQKLVDEYGEDRAKEYMADMGSRGGKKGGGKAGFHTMTKERRREVSAKGGRHPKKRNA